MLTAFLIATAFLFVVSVLSNSVYIANNFSERKTASIIGLIIYTLMFSWSMLLIFDQYS
jgi:hypothetical protein